jgi:hypothetical protein
MASTSKGKGAIKTRSWNKHLKKDGKKEHNKAVRRDSKKLSKEEDEEYQIKQFISSISSKKYAQAHKYLTNAVNSKIQARISGVAQKPFF